MRFNVVVANPPYNRTDIQLKFGLIAHELCQDYSLVIMPAKWQCKGDKTKEMLYSTFRNKVAPHMTHIKFFIQSTDVFEIGEVSGLTYYLSDKHNVHNIKTIENSCSLNRFYNDTATREFISNKSTLNNKGQVIIDKIKIDKPYKPSAHNSMSKQYQFWCNALICGNGIHTELGNFLPGTLLPTCGKTQTLSQGELNTPQDLSLGLQHDNYNILFASDSLDEVKSFMSYAYTRFVRFLIFNSMCGLRSTGQDTWWRFVPNQVFDHEFSDNELYKKYSLSSKDIEVIEGTISERPLSEVYSWIPDNLK